MLEETDGNDSKRWPLTRFALSLNYRATQSVENCIPTLEREERSS